MSAVRADLAADDLRHGSRGGQVAARHPAERAEMQRLLHEAMDAGLCGFSHPAAGRTLVQADFDGTPMVTDTMADEDVLALAEVLARPRRGLHPDHPGHRGHREGGPAPSSRGSRGSPSGPVLHNVVAAADPKINRAPEEARRSQREWPAHLRQGSTCAPGSTSPWRDWNLYDSSPAWNAATKGTKEEKLQKLSDPEVRSDGPRCGNRHRLLQTPSADGSRASSC